MKNLNQHQFDKKFLGIVAGEKLHEQHSTWEGVGPIKTTVGTECNNCGKEVDTNSVYYPKSNVMEWTCPHCGEEDSSDNWHDYAEGGNLRHYDTGETITPQNIHKFF